MKQPSRSRAAALALAAALASIVPVAAAPAQAVVPAGCKGNPSNTYVNVSIEGLRSGSGLVAVTLYPDDPRRFLVKKGSLKVARVAADSPVTRMCLFVPAPGTYAVAVYHDEDASKKLNRNGLGLPKEGFGFSNNPATIAGLPAFKSVRIRVPGSGASMRIKMKYP
jgi:uncharacterized protein (DUF2141 family)